MPKLLPFTDVLIVPAAVTLRFCPEAKLPKARLLDPLLSVIVPPPEPASVATLLVLVSDADPGVPPARFTVMVPVLDRLPEPDSVILALVVLRLLAEPLKVWAPVIEMVPEVASMVAFPLVLNDLLSATVLPLSPRVPNVLSCAVVIAPAAVTFKLLPEANASSTRALEPLLRVIEPAFAPVEPVLLSLATLLVLVRFAEPAGLPVRSIRSDPGAVTVPPVDSVMVPPLEACSQTVCALSVPVIAEDSVMLPVACRST